MTEDGHWYETHWGLRFSLSEGSICTEMPAITRVGLHNLCEVQSHEITRIVGSTSHTVRFHDGGFVQFAYNDRGALIELSGWHFAARMHKDGTIVVGAFDADTHGT